MTDPTPDKQTNFQGSITGSAVDGGSVNAENIAGRDMNITHNYAPPPAEKTTFPLHHIPHPQNPNFTGREEIFQQVADTLNAGQTTVVTQTIAGLGGVGKTQLALAYCYAHLDDYDLIYWLSADSEPGLGESMMALARRLKLVAPTVTDQQLAVQTVLQFLSQTSQRWLLVYDNADQIEPRQLTPYLPRAGSGHVLITSRNPNYGGVGKVLEMGLFTLDEAVDFLFQRKGAKGKRGSKEWDEAVALAEGLGRFPLALEHAAAYVESKGSSYAAYYRLFTSRRAELWQRANKPEQYHATITTTWELAFDEVKKTPGALELLNLCCFLDPESIPLELIKQVANADTLHATSIQTLIEDELALDDAIGALRRYSLIQISNDMLSFHKLVQLVIRSSLDQSSKEHFASLTFQIFIAVLKGKNTEISFPLLSHVRFLTTNILGDKKVLSDEFISSSADVDKFLQHIDDYLEFQEINLENAERLTSEIIVLTNKLERLDARFSSQPDSSFHQLLVSDFQEQYRELQEGFNKILKSARNFDVLDIPDIFVLSKLKDAIVKVPKLRVGVNITPNHGARA